jgi:hypothetical protein
MNNDDLARAELYDFRTGTSLTGEAAYLSLRCVSASSLLTNGKVLNTFEYWCHPTKQAEVFDASTETFRARNMTQSTGPFPNTSTVGCNTPFTGGTNNIDVSPLKSEQIAERARLAFRCENQNLLNHPQLVQVPPRDVVILRPASL